MDDKVKLIIEIPEKTIAHIRSDYGHGCKTIYDEDKDKIVDAIYHGTPLDNVKAEFINLYPINDMDELVADGTMFWFSLNKVLEILDNIGKESEEI